MRIKINRDGLTLPKDAEGEVTSINKFANGEVYYRAKFEGHPHDVAVMKHHADIMPDIPEELEA